MLQTFSVTFLLLTFSLCTFQYQYMYGSHIIRRSPITSSSFLSRWTQFAKSKHCGPSTLNANTISEAESKFSKEINDQNSSLRINCRHFELCSGCTVKDNLDFTPIMVTATKFALSVGVKMPITIGNATRWRTHAKLAIQPQSKWGGIKIGLFKSNSHEVITIPDCQVHHENINFAVELIRSIAVEAGVKAYVPQNEKLNIASEGELRYMQLTVERLTGRLQIVFVINKLQFKELSPAMTRMLKKMKSADYDHLWHSISLNFHTRASNSIFNSDPYALTLLIGHKYMKEVIGKHTFFLPPLAFRQANLDAFEKFLIPQVSKYIPSKSNIIELYSGAGIIGMNMLDTSPESIICVDKNPFLQDAFTLSMKHNTRPEDFATVSFHDLTAEEAIDAGYCDGKNVMIVDPPRKGLDEKVIHYLIDIHPLKYAEELKRLIYVSCGFESLQRDASALLESKKWKLVAAHGFVLFPGSDHLETLFVFDRVDPQKSKLPNKEKRMDTKTKEHFQRISRK